MMQKQLESREFDTVPLGLHGVDSGHHHYYHYYASNYI